MYKVKITVQNGKKDYFILQISLLDSAINHLKANLKSAADLVSLPTTVEELQKVNAN